MKTIALLFSISYIFLQVFLLSNLDMRVSAVNNSCFRRVRSIFTKVEQEFITAVRRRAKAEELKAILSAITDQSQCAKIIINALPVAEQRLISEQESGRILTFYGESSPFYVMFKELIDNFFEDEEVLKTLTGELLPYINSPCLYLQKEVIERTRQLLSKIKDEKFAMDVIDQLIQKLRQDRIVYTIYYRAEHSPPDKVSVTWFLKDVLSQELLNLSEDNRDILISKLKEVAETGGDLQRAIVFITLAKSQSVLSNEDIEYTARNLIELFLKLERDILPSERWSMKWAIIEFGKHHPDEVLDNLTEFVTLGNFKRGDSYLIEGIFSKVFPYSDNDSVRKKITDRLTSLILTIFSETEELLGTEEITTEELRERLGWSSGQYIEWVYVCAGGIFYTAREYLDLDKLDETGKKIFAFMKTNDFSFTHPSLVRIEYAIYTASGLSDSSYRDEVIDYVVDLYDVADSIREMGYIVFSIDTALQETENLYMSNRFAEQFVSRVSAEQFIWGYTMYLESEADDLIRHFTNIVCLSDSGSVKQRYLQFLKEIKSELEGVDPEGYESSTNEIRERHIIFLEENIERIEANIG